MKNLSRRNFLKLSLSATAITPLTSISSFSSRGAVQNIPLGLQLYSVRNELSEDFPGTIAKLADMGFEGVEFAEYFGYSADELKKILDDNSLQCCGTHIMLDVLREDSFEETVAFNQALGNDTFIIRYIPPEDRDSRETFLKTIDEYNAISQRLAPLGMRLGYHNHDYIFEKFGEEFLWDILATNTDERFIMQLDTGHAAGMGQDPVKLIRRHPGRTISIHAKAYSAANEEAVVGDDELDWPGIIAASAEVGGIEWYILEYEIEGVPPLEAMNESIDNFRVIRGS